MKLIVKLVRLLDGAMAVLIREVEQLVVVLILSMAAPIKILFDLREHHTSLAVQIRLLGHWRLG